MTRQLLLVSALGAVLVIAVWWLFLYSPGRAELAAVQDEIAAAQAEQASLQQRIAALEAVRARAPETEAAIAQLRAVVPDDPALPSALRQLVAAADDAGISIDSLATTRPEEREELVGLNSATVTLTATGSYFQLVDFLRRVEDPTITARGLKFDTLAVSTDEPPTLTISLTGQMYSVLDPPPAPEDPTVVVEDAEDQAAEGETAEEDAA